MKTSIRKFILRLGSVLGFCLALLVVFLLNPSLLYSHSTQLNNITIYHSQDLPQGFESLVQNSKNQIMEAAIYMPNFQTDLCLNDGSYYPALVKSILGDDVFRAFANKVVVHGEASATPNRFIKWGEAINFGQWIRHGLIHNLQFEYHGLLDANPLGNHPNWKWEGYAEYESIGRTRSFETLLQLYQQSEAGDFELVQLGDDEQTIKLHLKYLLATKYCFEVLELNYQTFMKLETTEEELYQQIIAN